MNLLIVNPEMHEVGPVQFWPPHCPYPGAIPVLVGGLDVVVVVVDDVTLVVVVVMGIEVVVADVTMALVVVAVGGSAPAVSP